jgi:hypothetical protein
MSKVKTVPPREPPTNDISIENFLKLSKSNSDNNWLNVTNEIRQGWFSQFANKCNGNDNTKQKLRDGNQELKGRIDYINSNINNAKPMLDALNDYNKKSENYYNNIMPTEHDQIDLGPYFVKIRELNAQIPPLIADISFNIRENNNFDKAFPVISNVDYNSGGFNDKLKQQNNDLISTDVNIKKSVYDSVNIENTTIDEKIESIQTNSIKHDRDSNFFKSNSNNYNFINLLLYGVYYLCVLGLVYVMTLTDLNIYIKIAIIILFLIYPFIIVPIESFVLYGVNMLHAFIMMTTYKDPVDKYDTSRLTVKDL